MLWLYRQRCYPTRDVADVPSSTIGFTALAYHWQYSLLIDNMLSSKALWRTVCPQQIGLTGMSCVARAKPLPELTAENPVGFPSNSIDPRMHVHTTCSLGSRLSMRGCTEMRRRSARGCNDVEKLQLPSVAYQCPNRSIRRKLSWRGWTCCTSRNRFRNFLVVLKVENGRMGWSNLPGNSMK